jgi:hypothetical protein
LDYYYWNNKVGIYIYKEFHLVKRVFHVKTREATESEKRAKRKSRRRRLKKEELEAKGLPD